MHYARLHTSPHLLLHHEFSSKCLYFDFIEKYDYNLEVQLQRWSLAHGIWMLQIEAELIWLFKKECLVRAIIHRKRTYIIAHHSWTIISNFYDLLNSYTLTRSSKINLHSYRPLQPFYSISNQMKLEFIKYIYLLSTYFKSQTCLLIETSPLVISVFAVDIHDAKKFCLVTGAPLLSRIYLESPEWYAYSYNLRLFCSGGVNSALWTCGGLIAVSS